MSKRRRGSAHTYYKVPSLQVLALEAIRKRGSKTYSHSHSNLRESIFKMADSDMGESRSSGTQTTSAAKEGAKQVGQGHPVTIPRSIPHGFNNTYTVRLTYADVTNHVFSGAGGSGSQYWSLNSIYDPNASGGGHQPLMRDLWASQYDYYTVLACHYHIEIYNCAADSIGWTVVGTNLQKVSGCIVTMIPTTNTSDVTNAATGFIYPAVEMKNTQSKALWPEGLVEFNGTLTPGDFLVDAKDADSDQTWTAVGSNPTIQRYLGLAYNSVNSGGFGGATETPFTNIQIYVKFDYDVQFTQLNQALRTTIS